MFIYSEMMYIINKLIRLFHHQMKYYTAKSARGHVESTFVDGISDKWRRKVFPLFHLFLNI